MLLSQIVLYEARLNDQHIKNIAPKLLATIAQDHSAPTDKSKEAKQAISSKDDYHILNAATQVIDFFKENIDPSPNKVNMSWIVKTYNNREWLWEDYTNINHQITEFMRVQNSPELVIKNLDQYKTLNQLINALQPLVGRDLVSKKQEKKQGRDVMYDQTKIVYKDKDVIVLTPLTEEAAKYFGKSTRWCTTWENNNQFNTYNSQGPLFIILCRDKTKWQFHYESNQFKDSADLEIFNRRDWADKYPTAANALRDKSILFGKYDLVVGKISPDEFIKGINNIFDLIKQKGHLKQQNSKLLSSLLQKCDINLVPPVSLETIIHYINEGKLDAGIVMLLPNEYKKDFDRIGYIKHDPSKIELFSEDELTDEVVNAFVIGCFGLNNFNELSIISYWVSNITEHNQKKLIMGVLLAYKQKHKKTMKIGFLGPTCPLLTWKWFWTDMQFIQPFLTNLPAKDLFDLAIFLRSLTPAQQQRNIVVAALNKTIDNNPIVLDKLLGNLNSGYQYRQLPSFITSKLTLEDITRISPKLIIGSIHFPKGYTNGIYVEQHLIAPLDKLPDLFNLAVNQCISKNINPSDEYYKKNYQRNYNYEYIQKDVVQKMIQKNPIAAILVPYKEQTPKMLTDILDYTNNTNMIKWGLGSMGPKSVTNEIFDKINDTYPELIDYLPKSTILKYNKEDLFAKVVAMIKSNVPLNFSTLTHNATLLQTNKLTKEQIKTLYSECKASGIKWVMNTIGGYISLAKLSEENWSNLMYYFPIIINRVTFNVFVKFVNSGYTELVLKTLSQKGQFLIKLPEDKITLDMARVAISHKRSLFKSDKFPEKFKSDDIIKKMAKISNPGKRIEMLPQSTQDKIKLVENVIIFQSDLFNILFEHKIKDNQKWTSIDY